MQKKLILATLFSVAWFMHVEANTNNAPVRHIDMKNTEALSPYVFGHNLEHTRAAINEGLSAQMLRNRKFAGKPSRNRGVASKWFGIGEKVLFMMDSYDHYTRHICLQKMSRWNELEAQVVENLTDGQTAGIGQHELSFVANKAYELRIVTKVSAPVTLKVELTDRSGKKKYASETLNLKHTSDWQECQLDLTPSASDEDGTIRYTFSQKAEVTFGALSMMPRDNFHGMRPDVVANLKAIGPRLIRWPGGNFAGEYRWKDGLLPVDQRGPLEAATEIETQPYSDGYDYHEINTDDFIALCREVGAEPLLTINLFWSTPEESAQWVEYCNGDENTEYGKLRAERGHKAPYNVRFWSLGNEMGYGHMEGPKGAEGYATLAESHADAMLAVTPNLELFSSGPYPNDDWANNSAARLADKVKYISMHNYVGPAAWGGAGFHFTTPEETKATYTKICSLKSDTETVKRMRQSLDKTGKKLHISFDEWNQWFAWYRPSCVSEGIYAARFLHFILSSSNELDMPVVCYFQPVGEGAILIEPNSSRLTANGQMFALMKEHQDGLLCKVDDNDDFSAVATLKGDTLTMTLVNESYDESRDFCFALGGHVLESILYSSDDVRSYTYFTTSTLPVNSKKKSVTTTLPAHSVAMIKVKVPKTVRQAVRK